jgi:hypothetical protein
MGTVALDNYLRYVISPTDVERYPSDAADYRAYFYWHENGSTLEKSYSLAELEAHIERCKAKGAPTTLLEAALRRLRSLN